MFILFSIKPEYNNKLATIISFFTYLKGNFFVQVFLIYSDFK